MNENQHMGGQRPPLRRSQDRRHGTRHRASRTPQLHGRGYQTPTQRRRNANGYQLQRHAINFAGRRGKINAIDPRVILLVGVALVAVVLIVSSVVSCVSQAQAPAPADDRVAEGLPDDLSNALKQALSRDDQLAQIAQNAGDYPESLVRLALDEPDATGFVYTYPSADKEAEGAFDETVTAGEVPALFGWDRRWGYLDYGGSPLAVSGSGPVACAMGRMALLGNADQTPGSIAGLAAGAHAASGDAGTDASFFTSQAGALGLDVSELDLAAQGTGTAGDASSEGQQAAPEGDQAQGQGQTPADRLASSLGDVSYVLLQSAGGALGETPRWVLVAAGPDGAVTVHDPLSTQNSSHPWDPATVAGDCAAALVLRAAGQTPAAS